jgi:molybdopterin converting factor small subunit
MDDPTIKKELDRIREALDTVARTTLGENFELLRNLEANLSERFQAAREQGEAAQGDLKVELMTPIEDLSTKLDEAQVAQRQALAEVDGRVEAYLVSLKRQVDEAQDRLDAGIASREERIQGVERTVAQLREELRQQAESNRQASSMLQNVATLFSGGHGPTASMAPTTAVTPPTAVTPVAPTPSPSPAATPEPPAQQQAAAATAGADLATQRRPSSPQPPAEAEETTEFEVVLDQALGMGTEK